jgi:uncharacterized protein YdhG (YjbR/CyaY superfamily)
MPEKKSAPIASIDEYIAQAPGQGQAFLKKIRSLAKRLCPNADEIISYGMPALKEGRVFFYFAAFKSHIGIYPPIPNDSTLIKELKVYRGPKGNLQFQYTEDIPYALIEKVVLALHYQHAIKK